MDEGGDTRRVHLPEDGIEEKGEPQVLDAAQPYVQPAGWAVVTLEQHESPLPEELGQGPHRADPGAEGALEQEGDSDDGKEDDEPGGVDRVDLSPAMTQSLRLTRAEMGRNPSTPSGRGTKGVAPPLRQ